MRSFEDVAQELQKRAINCLSEADIALAADKRSWCALALEMLRLASDFRALGPRPAQRKSS